MDGDDIPTGGHVPDSAAHDANGWHGDNGVPAGQAPDAGDVVGGTARNHGPDGVPDDPDDIARDGWRDEVPPQEGWPIDTDLDARMDGGDGAADAANDWWDAVYGPEGGDGPPEPAWALAASAQVERERLAQAATGRPGGASASILGLLCPTGPDGLYGTLDPSQS